MENRQIRDRLCALRKAMKAENIDFYMVPTADFHNSEYVSGYFKAREYFSNFTGSNGTLLVWQKGAGLWTDGRYFIQAERELEGTGVSLFRMGEEGVPGILEFLKANAKQGDAFGFDGRVVSAAGGISYEKQLAGQGVSIRFDRDLAGDIWEGRPALPCEKTYVLEDGVTGRSAAQKLGDVRKKLKEKKAAGFLLTKLDDIMWLFNIRGRDVACNPVALSYAYVDGERSFLFIQEEALTAAVREHLSAQGVETAGYGEILPFLENGVRPGTKVLADRRHCNYALYKKLEEKCAAVPAENPTELLKAVKNPVELANMERVYIEDSAAVTRFICWLKQNVGKIRITEVSAADYLESLRRRIPGFLDLSFPTIAGYGANAAMMHYEATPESHEALRPEGMLLVDSGGQYLGGTTDVTRTVALGPITDEVKRHYTAVVSGMLQLSDAKWLHGCTGRNLDILARQPLWDMGIDYKCGTGHGVGYVLNVHEGPQNIRWKYADGFAEAVLEEGMDVTNEPGVYVEGSHGIRIENVMVARNGEKNGDGQFMYFDTLTYVPIDLEAIEVRYMTEENRARLNRYHRRVREKIGPYLSGGERDWLEEATREI